MNHFNVGELTQVIPFMPDISGFLHGDFHYMQADSTTTVSAEMLVKRMAYNGVRIGDIGLNGVYFPNADGSHYVDGIVTLDEQEVLLVNGRYHEEKGKGKMEGEASFQKMPFAILNAFMPDGPFAMSGYAWGDFKLTGFTDNPILNGELKTESLHIDAELQRQPANSRPHDNRQEQPHRPQPHRGICGRQDAACARRQHRLQRP